MNFDRIKSDLQKVYDDLAVYWGKDDSLHDWGQAELREFAELVKYKGAKVLDLGCGSGVQTKLLIQEGLEVTGLDISPKMIKEARLRVPKAKFVVGDITNLPFEKESFDGVYARASLLHVPKNLLPRVLKSIFKILKEGGILYLAVKEGEGEREVEDKRHGQKVKRFFSYFQEKELKDFLEEAGFEILKSTKFKRTKTSTNWLQIFARKA